VRILLTLGHRLDPATLGRLPANVHVEPWVEQLDVLAAATLVVCHGGSGTVFGALAAGVPVVVVPSFADQFANGRRMAAAGAGITVEADPGRDHGARRLIADHDAPRITTAVDAALTEPGYREAARRISAEMSTAPIADEIMARLLAS